MESSAQHPGTSKSNSALSSTYAATLPALSKMTNAELMTELAGCGVGTVRRCRLPLLPPLKPSGNMLLKLKYDRLLSIFAF